MQLDPDFSYPDEQLEQVWPVYPVLHVHCPLALHDAEEDPVASQLQA